jgi:hypothetical protein
MTVPKPTRRMTRLPAAQTLAVGEWIIAHKDILTKYTRAVLAQMASEALGYAVSQSTIALQGDIRNLHTGRPYTFSEPTIGNTKSEVLKRLDKVEHDIRVLANIARAINSRNGGPRYEALDTIGGM